MFRALENLRFDNRYAGLGEDYGSRVEPTPFTGDAAVISINEDVFHLLEIDPQQAERDDFYQYITGIKKWPGTQPLAMRYSGHQFGHYVPQLGDGRAILLGQVRVNSGETYDMHVKGAGMTAYSRQGDGRAVLRSSIREYLCGEAMHGLGIPTTRSLCLIGSTEEVYRESIESGAIIVRVAPSHVRFGSFELFFYRQEHDKLKPLADYVIEEHFPELTDAPDRYLDWLSEVIRRTAQLMAQWQSVGFAHGVMNTDNMSVLGLTLDYGPYGFLDTYNPDFICNDSDHMGRYAFNCQPGIGLWNCSCFAQAILPLLHDEPEAGAMAAKELLEQYQVIFNKRFIQLMRDKLGLKTAHVVDHELINDLLGLMAKNNVDYTIFFRSLMGYKTGGDQNAHIRNQFIDRPAFDAWSQRYEKRLLDESSIDVERAKAMSRVNPRYVLRNYMAQTAIEQAGQGDYNEIERLLRLLKDPFRDDGADSHYADYPPDWAGKLVVSCSS